MVFLLARLSLNVYMSSDLVHSMIIAERIAFFVCEYKNRIKNLDALINFALFVNTLLVLHFATLNRSDMRIMRNEVSSECASCFKRSGLFDKMNYQYVGML